MRNSKGYGLIEVLISLGIFFTIITNSNAVLCKLLLHAKQTEAMHTVIHMVLELNEQLHMLPKNNDDIKLKLIQAWAIELQQRVSGYCVETNQNLNTIQVSIKKQQFQLLFDIVV